MKYQKLLLIIGIFILLLAAIFIHRSFFRTSPPISDIPAKTNYDEMSFVESSDELDAKIDQDNITTIFNEIYDEDYPIKKMYYGYGFTVEKHQTIYMEFSKLKCLINSVEYLVYSVADNFVSYMNSSCPENTFCLKETQKFYAIRGDKVIDITDHIVTYRSIENSDIYEKIVEKLENVLKIKESGTFEFDSQNKIMYYRFISKNKYIKIDWEQEDGGRNVSYIEQETIKHKYYFQNDLSYSELKE